MELRYSRHVATVEFEIDSYESNNNLLGFLAHLG